jgi:hypothetical protein
MPGRNGGLRSTEVTNIRIGKEIKKEFDKLGQYGENASDILTRVVKFYTRFHNAKGELITESPSIFDDVEYVGGKKK